MPGRKYTQLYSIVKGLQEYSPNARTQLGRKTKASKNKHMQVLVYDFETNPNDFVAEKGQIMCCFVLPE